MLIPWIMVIYSLYKLGTNMLWGLGNFVWNTFSVCVWLLLTRYKITAGIMTLENQQFDKLWRQSPGKWAKSKGHQKISGITLKASVKKTWEKILKQTISFTTFDRNNQYSMSTAKQCWCLKLLFVEKNVKAWLRVSNVYLGRLKLS